MCYDSIFPCNTSTDYIPAIEFAGESFQINPLDFSIGAISEETIEDLALGNQTIVNDLKSFAASSASGLSNYCIAGLIGADLTDIENLYVVGDVFIKNVS